jgi:hypothetical protein
VERIIGGQRLSEQRVVELADEAFLQGMELFEWTKPLEIRGAWSESGLPMIIGCRTLQFQQFGVPHAVNCLCFSRLRSFGRSRDGHDCQRGHYEKLRRDVEGNVSRRQSQFFLYEVHARLHEGRFGSHGCIARDGCTRTTHDAHDRRAQDGRACRDGRCWSSLGE